MIRQLGFQNVVLILTGILSLLNSQPTICRSSEPTENSVREVAPGITTGRIVPGEPYDLAGKRVVFTNWYYVDPGDFDWRDDTEKSVYVKGDVEAFGAHHIGIRAPHGIRLVAEQPEVRGPFERPHRMIIQEGDLYKGWTDSDYFESKDAMHWEKKAKLDLGETKGDGLYQIFIDPSAAANERYKAIWTAEINGEHFKKFREEHPDDWEPRALVHLSDSDQIECIRGGTSPDGIHWQTLPDPLFVEYCDTWNTAYYDTVLHEYVIYTRQWSIGPYSKQLQPNIRNSWTGAGRRAVGRTSSRDFAHFEPSEMILEPTPEMLPSEQIYTNCYTTIPGAPDEHLMFPAIWNASISDTTRIEFASSHDGKVWHWVPGGDLLRTQAFGSWNGGCIWVTPNLLELPNGDWALPYVAHSFPHKYPRGKVSTGTGYAVWPKGRLVAIEAADQGEFTMIRFMNPGTKLKINALTSRTGWIKVEVVGVKNQSLTECTPIIGDQHWTTLDWKGNGELGVPKGKPLTLRISMSQAKLYGLEFE
jgi:hypothetical protein